MAEEQRGVAVESESVEALTGRDVVEPTVATAWTQQEAHRRKAAPLRMYLGAPPTVIVTDPGIGYRWVVAASGEGEI
jgi:hypothetical protein